MGTIERAHLYSMNGNAPRIRTEAQEVAERAAWHLFSNDDMLFPLPSILALFNFMMMLKSGMLSCREVYIYAHGQAGAIQIGSTPVFYKDWDQFAGQGWETVFAPDATVQFNCCNLAGSAEGEAFLAEFASIFLRRGGRAYAAKGYVIAHPWTGSSFTLGACGSGWLRADVSPSGAVSLHNASYLNSRQILTRLDAVQEKLKLISSIAVKPGVVTRKIDLGDDLDAGATVIPLKIARLKKDYGVPPSLTLTNMYDSDQGPPVDGKVDWYLDLLDECRYLDRMESKV